jgi:hypothetical protein
MICVQDVRAVHAAVVALGLTEEGSCYFIKDPFSILLGLFSVNSG